MNPATPVTSQRRGRSASRRSTSFMGSKGTSARAATARGSP